MQMVLGELLQLGDKMEITITIPEESKETILNAFVDRFGGEEQIIQKEDFFKKCLLEYIVLVSQNYREREAQKSIKKEESFDLEVI